jgi:hypothetical protein
VGSGTVDEERSSGARVCWTKGRCPFMVVGSMKQSVSVIVWEGGHPEEPGLGLPSWATTGANDLI